MEDLPLPGGCKSMEEFSAYIHHRIKECMKDYKSKEETMQHLTDQFQIPHVMTSIVWDLLEAKYPESFRSHYKSCETYRKIREASRIESYKLIPRFFRDKREKDQHRRSNIQRDDDDDATSQAPQGSNGGDAFVPRGFKSVEEFSYYVHGRIMECMRDYKSKEETVKHLSDLYRIPPESTKTVWDRLEQGYQDNFRSYYEACENKRKLREQEAPKVTATAQITTETRSCKSSERERVKQDKAASTSVVSKTLILRSLNDINVKKQEQQRTCPPPDQSLMETAPASRVSRLGPDANGVMHMNLEDLLLLLNRSRDGA
ncbi:hypothetical protein HID58_076480 [Brassica napus]|uniref:Uncharacterized protein n=2 Tax=Brassica TaxID=3705 RepID=A0ABQ7YQ71_BRANA|nr:uncharacterized protein LOC111207782 isoform X1 [Brassica napus]KAG2264540.1 hypothetical protein Bca52824_071619 [Brassica carinata]KAH0869458.1 hypothetical protein HID58_076480 [Brassica napus]